MRARTVNVSPELIKSVPTPNNLKADHSDSKTDQAKAKNPPRTTPFSYDESFSKSSLEGGQPRYTEEQQNLILIVIHLLLLVVALGMFLYAYFNSEELRKYFEERRDFAKEEANNSAAGRN